MANLRGGLHRLLAVCLAVGSACSALFGVALLATAVTGRDTPSSFLLGGFGFVLLVVAGAVLVTAVKQWTTPRHGQDGMEDPHYTYK